MGHVRRNLAIAAAIVEADPSAAVLVATSAEEVAELGIPERVDVLRLPGVRKVANGRYVARRLALAPSELRDLRAALLEAAVDGFRPTVLLADKHPLGVGGELRRALRGLRAAGGLAALGLRDILDDGRSVRDEWARQGLCERIAGAFERVLIYGDRAVFDPVIEYGLPPKIAAMTRFCGYVVREDEFVERPVGGLGAREQPPLVLATAGGGEDGFALLRTFVDAAADASWQGAVVCGRQENPWRATALQLAAEQAGVAFRSFVPSLPSRLGGVGALVCMGGYNTLAESLAAGVPAVCVPRAAPRQEQLIRARAFSRLGLLRMLEPQALDPCHLRAEIAGALAASHTELRRRVHAQLTLQGAQLAAAEILELHERARPATAPLATR